MKSFPVTSELLYFLVVFSLPLVGLHLLYRFRRQFVDGLLASLNRKFCLWVDFPRGWIDSRAVSYVPLGHSTLSQTAWRFKFTLIAFFLNVYTYVFTTGFNGEINGQILEKLGFNYLSFASHQWFILITSNFIHFNLLHLCGNMGMLLLFTGALELLMGSGFASLVYLTAMNSNIPNGLFLLPTLRVFFPSLWSSTVHYTDVGASLGIIGTLGGLSYLLTSKFRRVILTLIVLGSVVGSFYVRSLFGLDHVFSAILGYFTASYLTREKRLKESKIEHVDENVYKMSKSLARKKTGTDD